MKGWACCGEGARAVKAFQNRSQVCPFVPVPAVSCLASVHQDQPCASLGSGHPLPWTAAVRQGRPHTNPPQDVCQGLLPTGSLGEPLTPHLL